MEIAVPLKCLSNFSRTLDIPLINCEKYLILTLSQNCVITSKARRDYDSNADHAIAHVSNPRNATFKIKRHKIICLSTHFLAVDGVKLLEQSIENEDHRTSISQYIINQVF